MRKAIPFLIIAIIAIFITYQADRQLFAWLHKNSPTPGPTSIDGGRLGQVRTLKVAGREDVEYSYDGKRWTRTIDNPTSIESEVVDPNCQHAGLVWRPRPVALERRVGARAEVVLDIYCPDCDTLFDPNQ